MPLPSKAPPKTTPPRRPGLALQARAAVRSAGELRIASRPLCAQYTDAIGPRPETGARCAGDP